MKKEQLLYLLLHPITLSVIISFVVLQFLPPIFEKYSITQISKERTSTDRNTYYYDLNNNSYSEKIEVYRLENDNIVGVIVYTKGGVINQWNFNGEVLNEPSMFFDDINNDGILEIFISTLFNNTIYLSCFNPFENKYYFKEKGISDYFKRNDKIICTISKCTLYDFNNDSINEIYFSLSTGYAKQPRGMYAYDFVNDTLYKSPFGFALFENPFSFDIDGDGKPEFFGSPQAVGNSKIDDLYSDHFAWLMLLDEKMNFKFKPKKIGYFPSFTSIIPFVSNNNSYMAVLIIYSGTKEIKSSLTLYDSKGRKVKERIFDKNSEWVHSRLYTDKNNYRKLFLIYGKGEIDQFDENLEIINTYNLPKSAYGIPKEFDLDNDGELELIFSGEFGEALVITRNDFSDPTIIDISDIGRLYSFSLIEMGKNGNQLFVHGSKYSYIFKYESSILYYLEYIIYVGIFLGFFSIIVLIQKSQRYRIEKRYIAERKIAELQMKSIKNQIDPHFTLNLINSIGSLFAKQDIEKANYIFGKYSKLLRTTILGSDNILTTLKSEIEYVENYLALEKFRLQNKFEYKIEIDDSVNQKNKIPKTLIHTFVENAIKHGLRHLEVKGELNISIRKSNPDYIICIRDNGIGRAKAKELSIISTGKGLSIMNQILELYLNLEKVQITYKIIDLFDNENNSIGTEVCIDIPINETEVNTPLTPLKTLY
ncbi:MAG: histidine kinase [Melioribacteraceae bacterium]|nr:histidine kinase [Melioribacteraceae bacterium]